MKASSAKSAVLSKKKNLKKAPTFAVGAFLCAIFSLTD
jgi:hypothetical protein